MNKSLQVLFGSGFKYKSEAQENALQMVIKGAAQILISLPTGGGKSLSFIGPALLNPAVTSLLIVPLVALRDDMLRRLQEAKVSCKIYSQTDKKRVTVIVCTVEQAVQKTFLSDMAALVQSGTLQRIIIDEIHLVSTEATFRPAFAKLLRLRKFPVQFIGLSATLPMQITEDVCSTLLLNAPGVVRAEPCEPSFVNDILPYKSKDDIVVSIARLNESASRRLDIAERRIKVLVYTFSIKEAKQWANRLDGKAYFAGLPDSEKKEIISNWRPGENQTLVATAALGLGID
ncbi:P-loop containing nucleoside triphosphate hydrolase protein, partial [Ascobolus immersus RN42]